MGSSEKFALLPRKYAIGKRPLSKVLGWGELTYTRILDGSNPSASRVDEIEKLYDDPVAYIVLLNRARDNGLITDSTYQKSKSAAESYIVETEDLQDTMKVQAVALYICALGKGDFTPHALNLLLYYAQGHSLEILEHPLFNVAPRATEYGPAYDAVEQWFSFEQIQDAGSRQPDDVVGLSKREMKLLRRVYDRYGIYSAAKLTEMACSESPCKKTLKRVDPTVPSSYEISLKRIAKHFHGEAL